MTVGHVARLAKMLSWPIVFVSIKRPTTLLPEVAHPRGVASTHVEYVAPSISRELVGVLCGSVSGPRRQQTWPRKQLAVSSRHISTCAAEDSRKKTSAVLPKEVEIG
jgi:hypothetical protein